MAIRENELIYIPFRNFLRDKGWLVTKTHGNAFQKAFPDSRASHHAYGGRWVEYKVIDRTPKGTAQVHLTTAQKNIWPKWHAYGEKIWVVCAEDLRGPQGIPIMEKWYKQIIYGEPNVHFFFHHSTIQYGIHPSI